MEIRVPEIRFMKGDKATQAFADIEIDGITICDFRVMENGGKPYVKAPFTTYKSLNGELRFRQIVKLPVEVQGRIDNAILSVFYRERENQNAKQNR